MTCQQLDCMQRHAEGHGNLWHKQAIVLNENHHQQQLHEQQRQQQQMLQQKTDIHLTLANQLILSTSSSTATNVTALTDTTTTTTTTTTAEVEVETETSSTVLSAVSHEESGMAIATAITASPSYGSSIIKGAITASTPSSSPTLPQPQPPPLLLLPQTTEDVTQKPLNLTTANTSPIAHLQTTSANALNSFTVIPLQSSTTAHAAAATTAKASSSANKPNDWVVIPVFADIVKLALAGREDCLQR